MLLYPYRPSSQSVSMSQYTLYDTHLSTEYIRTLYVVIPLPSTLHSLYPCHSILCMTLTCIQSILEHCMLLYPYRPSSTVCIHVTVYFVWHSPVYRVYSNTPCCYTLTVHPPQSVSMSQCTLYDTHLYTEYIRTLYVVIPLPSILTVRLHVTVYFVWHSPVYRVY